MSKKEIKAYFDTTIIKYNKGDICELLDKKITSAAPFLAIVFNGIDNLGGMCLIFPRKSGHKEELVLA